MMTPARSLETVEAEIAATKEALANVKGSETEVYARIVGYYRSVRNWNKGKRDEYNHRKQFVYEHTDSSIPADFDITSCPDTVSAKNTVDTGNGEPAWYEFFGRTTCPNCPPVKEFLTTECPVEGQMIDVDSENGLARAAEKGVFSAPTVIIYDANRTEISRAHSASELKAVFTPVPASV